MSEVKKDAESNVVTNSQKNTAKKANAVIMKENDNVATAVVDLKRGDQGLVRWKEKWIDVILKEDIPFGHKFAIQSIAAHKEVIKYGEHIGVALQDIKEGEHVHVQNVDSVRGKGGS